MVWGRWQRPATPKAVESARGTPRPDPARPGRGEHERRYYGMASNATVVFSSLPPKMEEKLPEAVFL
jgi:hypothetical protein